MFLAQDQKDLLNKLAMEFHRKGVQPLWPSIAESIVHQSSGQVYEAVKSHLEEAWKALQ